MRKWIEGGSIKAIFTTLAGSTLLAPANLFKVNHTSHGTLPEDRNLHIDPERLKLSDDVVVEKDGNI